MKRTMLFALLLLAACGRKRPVVIKDITIPYESDGTQARTGKEQSGHSHRQAGFYEHANEKINGKQSILLLYVCDDSKKDTTIRTTVDSVRYYVRYMRSTMPFMYDSAHLK